MLVCAVLASLAAGVLVAYGVCVAIFGIFRNGARPAPASAELPTRAPAGILEG
jgi:hypothetical protein